MSITPSGTSPFPGAVLAPLVVYPWSKTPWVAIELIMGPLDRAEPSDAVV